MRRSNRSQNAARASALGIAVMAIAANAAAVPPSKEVRVAAMALFDEGRALMAAGKYAEACPKLAESQRIDPGIGTLFNLSDCYERIGRTASAWVGFRDVAAEARGAGQGKREQAARERAAALEPKLSKLSIVVAPESAAPGLEIARDGAPVTKVLWGTAVPVDPGAHTVAATAPGRKRWETKVVLEKPGVVIVAVPVLEASADAPPPSSTGTSPRAPLAPTASAAPPGPSSGPPDARPGGWRAPLGIVVMGVGVAGLGVGTALGFVAKSTFNASNEDGHCDAEGFCDPTGLDLRDEAVTQGTVGTAVFIAGAALAVGGGILWLTAPSSAPSGAKPGAAAPVRIGIGPGGLVVKGAL